MSRTSRIILLTLIVLVAAILRTSAIGWGFIFDRKWHYVTAANDDERRLLRSIGQMDPKRLDFNPDDQQIEGSFYPYLVAAGLFTAEKIGFVELSRDADTYRMRSDGMKNMYLVARGISIAFSILEIFLVYAIGAMFVSPEMGLIAAAIFSVFPVEVGQGIQARAYAPANALMLAALFSVFRAMRLPHKKCILYVFGGVMAGLAFATRTPMLFTVLFFPVAEAVGIFRTGKPAMRLIGPALYALSFAALGVLIGVTVGNPYVLLHLGDTFSQATYQAGEGFGRSFADVYGRLRDLPTIAVSVARGITWAGLIIAAAGIVITCARRSGASEQTERGVWPPVLPLLFIGFAVPFWYTLLSGYYAPLPRYAMPLAPFFAIFAAVTIRSLWYAVLLPRRARFAVAAAICVFLIGYPLMFDIAYVKAARMEYPLEKLSRWIEQHILPTSTIGITQRDAYFKNIDYLRYAHIVELGGDLSGLAAQRPRYIVVFPHHGDWLDSPEPETVFSLNLEKNGYREIARIRNNLEVFGIPFKERLNRIMEYESRIYERSSP